MNIVLVKYHSSVKLAHLYEHIFVSNIHSYLAKRGIFRQLDYSLVGSTFQQGGFITLDFTAHSRRAARYIRKISKIPLDLGEGNWLVAVGICQIAAESSSPLGIGNESRVLADIMDLDSKPWLSLDSLPYIVRKGTGAAYKELYFVDEVLPRQSPLTINVKLSDDFIRSRPELAPLFHYISRILLINMATIVSRKTGTYPYEVQSSEKGVGQRYTLSTAPAPFGVAFSLGDVLSISEEMLDGMLKQNLVNRVRKDLASISYKHRSSHAPDFERMIIESSILIGAKGWRELATPETIVQILKHSTLSVEQGGKKLKAPLWTI